MKMPLFKRYLVIFACFLTSLGCGTMYVYSAYAPQLTDRLGLTATQSTLIGEAGTIGISLMGIISGRIIDRFGTTIPVFCGAILLFAGYSILAMAYLNVISVIPLLCLAIWMVGFGSVLGSGASIKAASLNFPKSRGTATAFPTSAFGLSAFIFSTLGGLAFKGDTHGFLLLLGITTGALVLIGSIFIKIYPQTPENSVDGNISTISPANNDAVTIGCETEAEDEFLKTATFEQIKSRGSFIIRAKSLSSRRPSMLQIAASVMSSSLNSNTLETRSNSTSSTSLPVFPDVFNDTPQVEMSENSYLLPKNNSFSRLSQTSKRTTRPLVLAHKPSTFEVSGLELLKIKDFWSHFIITGIVSGVGQMYIYCVGFLIRALINYEDPNTSLADMQHMQSFHVGLISILSFMGRLMSGVTSDMVVKRWNLQRMWLILISLLLMLTGYASVMVISTVDNLWISSVFIGLSYGVFFGCYPAIVGELFGSTVKFSQNYGLVTSSPVIFTYIFNLIFGKVYDSHVEHDISKTKGHHAMCLIGKDCYTEAFKFGILAIVFCFLLIVYLMYRHYLFIELEKIEEQERYEQVEPPFNSYY
ncbi:MFS general substrate transporter [Nadsonia fulvescens var. elongata DSM 6958]|uniref:MFS general substrate transporter n=1 Tax=Nadsonia fulvescens var. elongata DSM 6958 TaxID=857566 RepID=A0A1E3PII5_9ASCO|nr:MFS general substrate transporter [Nadsonia fulvescens var. elongata DSM 6958]